MIEIISEYGHFSVYYNGVFVTSEDTKHEAYKASERFLEEMENGS